MPSQKFSLGYDELINAESAIGRTLFGPIPDGHQREFFKLKENAWIWYESWQNSVGEIEDMVIRYDVRPTGVYKKYPNGNGKYEKLEGAELDNFVKAARTYYNLVKAQLYS